MFSGVAVCCGVCGVRCAVLRVRCPGPPGPCSPVRTPGVWCCVAGVLGRLAPVHWCACAVCCVVCLLSWASWLLFTGVPVLCVAWCVRCTGLLGSRSPLRPCGVCCVACSVSWASWLLFTGVLCAFSVGSVLCAVYWATWLLFTGALAQCVAWCVWSGCGCVLACAPPSLLPFSLRPRVGAVGVFMAQTLSGTPQRTRHWHSGQQGVQHPTESYLFFPSWPLCFWRRPRVSVSYCMHGGVCYLLVGLCTLCIL